MRANAGVAATLAVIVAASVPLLEPKKADWVEPITGMRFVLLPQGTFTMGSPDEERWREPQEVQHDVTLSRRVLIGDSEVTQDQWHKVMGTRPSRFDRLAPRLPVENVSWHDAQRFMDRLTKQSSAGVFRLPTEAEWEYACRAGSTTAYGLGDIITSEDANIDPRAPDDPDPRERDGATRSVGRYRPNAWGLYDMHGNVWEWTSDAHCPYTTGRSADPHPACEAPLKVIRGGSWRFRADSARCALRYTHAPGDRGYSLGFRVVLEPPAISP